MSAPRCACGKVCYSYTAAYRAAKQMRRRLHERLGVYRCRAGRCWHCGHSGGRFG